MALDRGQVQEKLLEEFSKKGYISEKEIDQCCDENDIDLFDVDKILQFLIDRKVLIQDSAPDIIKESDDEIYDRSQIDYEDFYEEVLNIYPDEEIFINDLRRIQPPQRNEWQILIPQAKQGNVFAKKRVISMYTRTIYRHAFNFSNSYGSDFKESFDDAIIGLYKAIDSYDITSPTPFPAYYSFYVLASMQRNYEKKGASYSIPNHHYQDMFSFISKYKTIIEIHGIDNLFDYVPERKIAELEEKFPDIYKYLLPTVEFDFNQIKYIDNFENLCIYHNLQELLDNILNTLPPREREILIMRSGFIDGNIQTLEEIGSYFDITRERVRQIEAKAFMRLRHPRRANCLRDFYNDKTNQIDIPNFYSEIVISEKKM